MTIVGGVLAVGIAAGIAAPKNRVVTAYLFAVLFIVCGWAYGQADYFSYQKQFYSNTDVHFGWTSQPLFYSLMRIIRSVGLDFQVTYIIVGAVANLLLIVALLKITEKVNYALSLFILSAFFLYIAQIRNFIAMAIVCYALRYLLAEGKKLLRYILLVLIAAGFHTSMLFYLIIIPIAKLSKRKVIVGSGLICIGGIILIPLADTMLSLLGLGKYTYYLGYKAEIRTVIIYDIFVVLGIATVFWACFLLKKARNISYKNNINMYSDLIWKLNSILLIVLPMQSVTVEAVRLYRNILPINFALISMLPINFYGNLRKGKITLTELGILSVKIFAILYAVAYGYLYVYSQCYDSLYIPILSNNILLG